MPTHKIGFYLNATHDLRALADEARRISQLQQVFVKSAPRALTQACCVKQLRAGTLFLLAENAAVAAKVRQLTPRLLNSCQKLGLEVTSIQVEVQVTGGAPAPISKREPRRLSVETIDNLESLAAGLEESPLKRALTKLATGPRNSK